MKEKIEKLIDTSQYDKACELVKKEFNIKMTAKFLKYDFHWDDDKEKRDIYLITLYRNKRAYSFNFGQSIQNSGNYETSLKHYALNSYGKYKFTQEEYDKLDYLAKTKAGHDIKRNTNYSIPNLYNIITRLTKYDPGTFEDFCSEFNYDNDTISALKTYNAVVDEYKNVAMLFNEDELEILNLIQ